jgi:hypothetical protein
MSKTKKANYYLLWSAIAEVMLDMYSEFKGYSIHVPTVQNKLLNLKTDLERNSKRIHDMYEKDPTGQEQLQFFRIVNIIEKLMDAAPNMDQFSERLGIIEKGLNGEYTLIEESEFNKLIKQTDESRTPKTDANG